jgi:hypothetical protein
MSESIADTKTRLEQFTLETNPEADIGPGRVLSELVIKLAATMQNPIANTMEELGQANTIKEALASETDTFNEAIDNIVSNYNITRDEGKKSTGKIKVTVSASNTYFFRTGYVFTQPTLNLNYVLTQDYTVRPTPDDDELALVAEGEFFYFVIPVEAEFGGAQYQVTNNTAFAIADETTIRNFVQAKAYGNFSSGSDIETDKQLLARVDTGLANKTLLTKASITARLKEDYSNFKDISLVGANDAEMTRSKKNIFGVSTLGMVDVYLRMANGVETVNIIKTAEKDADDGLWYISLDYNDVPGFYRVIAILPEESNLSGSLEFTQTFDYSLDNLTSINTVNDKYEGRFTKYQTCELAFEYAHPSGATSADFDLLISYQPNIGDIQDLFLSGEERIMCADYLVKAALPCYVSVGLKVHRKSTTTEFQADKLKQDIYNYVNNIKFGEALYASEIINLCHNYGVKYVETPIKLVGEIYTNKSTIISVANNDVLTIPTKLSSGVSPKTTVFITDYFKNSDDNRLSDAINIEVF